MARCRVIEAGGPTHERHSCAASALPQDLEALTHFLTRNVEESDADNTRLARQPMAVPVRDEREVARLQQPGFGCFYLYFKSGFYYANHHPFGCSVNFQRHERQPVVQRQRADPGGYC